MIAFLIVLSVVCLFAWFVGKSIGLLFGSLFFKQPEETYTFNSTHNHYHHHEHKNISIIDDKTKEEVIVYQKTISSKK